ncbi:hypothetical protein SAMN06309945_2076 [Okibacterium fritillariae]|uniref:Glycosyl transferase family 2 n=2 Tax=Okibacterium fritillariae TaxID=123320 RepID=A0A1T5KAS8_9MICO|nr:hypothetical protein SAMN06309945_2076 [Okibacterium fritillariae]
MMTRLGKAVSRVGRGLRTITVMSRLAVRNRLAKQSVLGQENVVVSLTSYGKRVQTVFYSIESVGIGLDRPARLILWLDDRDIFENLPKNLQRLQARGLEIRLTSNYGPHTKYYPAARELAPLQSPLVTADDDVLYSREWLSSLLNAYREDETAIVAHRVHLITTELDGSIKPYSTWGAAEGTASSPRNFGTGVSGVIYPPDFLEFVGEHGEAFKECAPQADDVWLHAMAIRGRFKVRQADRAPAHYPTIFGSQRVNLWSTNVFNGGNDQQIRETYSATDRSIIAGLDLDD